MLKGFEYNVITENVHIYSTIMEHVKRFIIDGKYVNYWKHGTPPCMEITIKMHMCIQMFIKLAIP
jgi:hypothetical protein